MFDLPKIVNKRSIVLKQCCNSVKLMPLLVKIVYCVDGVLHFFLNLK